jgi:hypothetical protein
MKYILISDGSSDRVLLNIINYTLKIYSENYFEGQRAELGFLADKVKTLEQKITKAIEYYEPDIIFIHRDAEKQTLESRETEIQEALDKLENADFKKKKFVRIIPIRMTEAWLLINEKAIRCAAGNPNGKIPLSIPKIKSLESIPDPKAILEDFLRLASGLSGRKLRDLNTRHSIQLIAEFIEDFSPLDQLSSYLYFKNQIQSLNL